MATYAQAATSLGDEMLMLTSLSGHEALGRPFLYTLDLLSHDAKVEFASVLNKPVSVQIELKEGYRFIHGIVNQFGRIGERGRHSLYRAVVRPWVWSLTKSSSCRIFSKKTVPDVITEVFRDHGYGDMELKLTREYREWEYLVQYRETALAFVHRLMEQEGIYYYFKHSENKHTMSIIDSVANYNNLPNYDEIPYFPPNASEQRERDHIDSWRVMQKVQPAMCAINDYDYKNPTGRLEGRGKTEFEATQFELYDYPGEYDTVRDGEAYARVWKEQLDASFELLEGQGNARGIIVGSQFKLKGCPREDQDRKYFVTETTCSLDTGFAESGPRTQPPTFRCSFRAQPASIPFRPQRLTPKPSIPGPQTAVVVAYDETREEIHTDEFGRIRVRFHWVRDGDKETASCWMRVAQPWAGFGFGAQFLPRVGHEVVVEFLEGDPDRPLITGCVYNAMNPYPYTLTKNRTQSGIKTRSSKGGNAQNYNEIFFEDLKGEELLRLQAERDLMTIVKHDATGTVEHDQKHDIKNNLTLTVAEGNYQAMVSTGWMKTKVPKNIYSVTAAELKLTVGESFIHMNKSGITLNAFGNTIVIELGGVTVNGAFIKLNP